MTRSLITGGTSGIGLAFAQRLAAEGNDLVLAARNTDRLEALATDMRDQYGVAVETLTADLATDEGCASVADRLRDAEQPIDMLVNNAGFGLDGAFWDIPVADLDRMLQVNVRAVVLLAHAALPGMRARGHGDVINVSSVAGFVPAGRSAGYAASKAYVTALSESLAGELDGTGVRVSALCPGFTHTEFHARAGLDMSRLPERMWLDADEVVATGLRDHRRGASISVPGMQYKMIVAGTRLVPRALTRRVTRAVRRRRF